MHTKTLFTSLLASSALALAVAGPAYADKKDRAQEAIAAAEAKLHTAEGIGAGVEVPAATAQARAALLRAKESLASGHKSIAIEEAIHASTLADTAVGELQRRKDASIVAARENERASAAAATESAAAAQDRADAATQEARQRAADADARAGAAEQAAANSAADAAAARTAAALAAQPTQVETTVSTQSRGAVVHRSTKSRVVKKAPTTTTRVVPATTDVTTTTTVTPAPR